MEGLHRLIQLLYQTSKYVKNLGRKLKQEAGLSQAGNANTRLEQLTTTVAQGSYKVNFSLGIGDGVRG